MRAVARLELKFHRSGLYCLLISYTCIWCLSDYVAAVVQSPYQIILFNCCAKKVTIISMEDINVCFFKSENGFVLKLENRYYAFQIHFQVFLVPY